MYVITCFYPFLQKETCANIIPSEVVPGGKPDDAIGRQHRDAVCQGVSYG